MTTSAAIRSTQLYCGAQGLSNPGSGRDRRTQCRPTQERCTFAGIPHSKAYMVHALLHCEGEATKVNADVRKADLKYREQTSSGACQNCFSVWRQRMRR